MQDRAHLIEEGVTLYPTAAEFADFRGFVNSLEKRPELQDQGIVKVRVTRSCRPGLSAWPLETSNGRSSSPRS